MSRSQDQVSLERNESQLNLPRRAGNYPDVCAVMVTYNPDSSFEPNVRALLPQVGQLIIVDNQSSVTARSTIAKTAAACRVEVVWNKQNQGIAAGLNAGIDWALSHGPFSWIATFDQDSQVSPDYVAAIFEAYSACPFADKVGIIGANYKRSIHEASDNSRASDFAFREIKSTMTSGSFLKTVVFDSCGRFDESLFMDYVDHEFCLRVRKHGFKVIQAGNALLTHRLGSPTPHRILWKRFTSTNHSPSRRYYNARNRLLVYRRYLSAEPLWVLSDAFGWLREIVKVTLYERDRTEKLGGIAKGVWDALRELFGRSGGSHARL